MAETSRAVYTVAPLLSCYVCICIHHRQAFKKRDPHTLHVRVCTAAACLGRQSEAGSPGCERACLRDFLLEL